MQVFGLPGHIIRTSRAASRLLGAKTPISKPREDATRWHDGGKRDGKRVDQRGGRQRGRRGPRHLYRWESAPSREPPPASAPQEDRVRMDWRRSIERLRLDHPMWGKAKLAPILRGQGYDVGKATVGRISRDLMRRGTVSARVPALIRKVAAQNRPKNAPTPSENPRT